MSQGLFTSVSGIRASQAKIDVISDNIANMNTAGFKASTINFETILSKTLTAGSAPPRGQNIGGTNPKQIGLGVAIGEIGRNFTGGNIQSTGRSSDLYIQGTGFFSLMNANGDTLLSRAGNFSADSSGTLINPKGMMVIGTNQVKGTAIDPLTGQQTITPIPVKVPQTLNLSVQTEQVPTGTSVISTLYAGSGTKIQPGTITLNITSPDGADADTNPDVTHPEINVECHDTVNTLIAKINAVVGAGAATLNATTGEITITPPSGTTIDYSGAPSDTSNFLRLANFTGGTSEAFKFDKVTIGVPDGSGSDSIRSSYSVGQNGAIEVSYLNGDKITVTVDDMDPNKLELQYKTSTGRVIDVENITVEPNVLQAANLQLQLASVVNPKGLVSEGGNLFSVGPNAGVPTYAIGGPNGMGLIESGALESSNVDLTAEFADMMLAQRAVEANSRTFEAQNTIMRTVVNLGR